MQETTLRFAQISASPSFFYTEDVVRNTAHFQFLMHVRRISDFRNIIHWPNIAYAQMLKHNIKIDNMNKNKKQIKWLKIAFFTALLIGAGYFFGVVCRQIDQAYNLILSPSKEFLSPLLWFLLALIVVTTAAGLVATLLRPMWTSIVAFGLSGLAILLAWQLTIGSGILVLLYFLAGITYVLAVTKKLDQRIKFSVQSISKSQGMLRIALILIACGSLYFGYGAHIEQKGFSIPEPYLKMISGQIEERIIKAKVPAKEYQKVVTSFRKEFKSAIDEFSKKTIKPYERFIPLAIVIALFTPLVTIVQLLAWIPTILLYIIFSLLKMSGVVKVISETKETEKLIIN